jgi:tRNA nucleotidyltransferase (CCA-adding enzyme)
MACRLPVLREMDEAPDALTVREDEVELLDLHGGRADLAARLLRCVGDPKTRFSEDALRILRGVRFSVQLGFDVDGATEDALAATASGLAKISVERIAAELTRMLDCPTPSRGLALMRRTGLYPYVLPEVDLSKNPYFTSEKDYYLAADALPCDHERRLALLLSGLAPEDARAVCRRLKMSNEATDAVTDYVAIAALPLPADEPSLRRSMARFGERFERGLALFAVCHPDQRGACEGTLATARTIRTRGDCLALSSLAVGGRDLMDELGLRGRRVGEVLHALLEAVLDDPARNDRETLLDIARRSTS